MSRVYSEITCHKCDNIFQEGDFEKQNYIHCSRCNSYYDMNGNILTLSEVSRMKKENRMKPDQIEKIYNDKINNNFS